METGAVAELERRSETSKGVILRRDVLLQCCAISNGSDLTRLLQLFSLDRIFICPVAQSDVYIYKCFLRLQAVNLEISDHFIFMV